MKKLIVFILIFSLGFISIGYSFDKVFGQGIEIYLPNQSEQEVEYLNQLDSISKQLEILSSNVLDKIINNEDKKELLQDSAYIKTQIRELRYELSEYHKTESGDIEKNPISLGLLNTLNYYSMSLSYLLGVIESDSSDISKYLELYYTTKSSGDTTLYWVREQIG